MLSRAPDRLRGLLGDEGADRLQEVMTARAVAVARGFAGDRVVVVESGDALPAALAGPLIVISADVPRLTEVHLLIARLDLDDGADVTFGPTMEGGCYLLGMQEAREDVMSVASIDWSGPDATGRTLAAAQAAGLEAGMLRMERRLAEPADAAALLADPLLDDEIRAVLEPRPR